MRSLVLAVTLGCAVVVSGSSLLAQETSERLTAPGLFPEKTLAYVRINDVKQLKQDLQRSSLGKLGSDEQLKPILLEFYSTLVQSTAAMQDAIGLNLDELLAIPSGELAIALLHNDRGESGEAAGSTNSGPAFAMLLDAGNEISSVQVLLNRIQTAAAQMEHFEKSVERLTLHHYQNPNRQRQQFAYFIDDGVIIACTDPDYLETLAGVWLGQVQEHRRLADNKKFTSIMSRCVGTEGERPQLSFYADPLEIVRQFVPKNAATSMTLAMLPALGIDGIEAVGGSTIVAPADFDSISHFHLSLSSPRRGVLSLLRPKTGSTAPEAWVPDSVASYATINWDLLSTLQGIERLYNQFYGEDALEQNVFAKINSRLELDFRKDILENLQGRISILQGFTRPVTISSGSNVYAIRLLNPEYVKANVLPKLLGQVEKRFPVTTESFGKLSAQVFEPVGRRRPANLRAPEICIAFIDDYILVADSRYMMRAVAECAGGAAGPLQNSLEYQLISDRVVAQLQERECSAISFGRPEESLQLFYELARDPNNREPLKKLAERSGFFKALLAALEKHELPPFAVIAKYLAPNGGFLVEEETGLHYMSFLLRRD